MAQPLIRSFLFLLFYSSKLFRLVNAKKLHHMKAKLLPGIMHDDEKTQSDLDKKLARKENQCL